jgi:hypothetical protein
VIRTPLPEEGKRRLIVCSARVSEGWREACSGLTVSRMSSRNNSGILGELVRHDSSVGEEEIHRPARLKIRSPSTPLPLPDVLYKGR